MGGFYFRVLLRVAEPEAEALSLQGCSDEAAVEQAREEAMKEGEARNAEAGDRFFMFFPSHMEPTKKTTSIQTIQCKQLNHRLGRL